MKRILIFLSFVFISQSVSADLINQNIINGCNTNVINIFDNISFFKPQFTINSYNCPAGYYLPANALGCVQCLSGHECIGGVYNYNSTKDQGIKYKNPISENVMNGCDVELIYPTNGTAKFKPMFNPIQIICNPGYYLGADDIECTICPIDHYCPGGNLTFNETTPQGIIDCPENHPFAPAGMWQQSQCGRKLHVGEDILYMHQQPAHPTIHRLYVGHPNGIYSANAVPRDINSDTFPKMSEGMSKGFHVTIDNVEYLICDDSVPECRNDP